MVLGIYILILEFRASQVPQQVFQTTDFTVTHCQNA